MRLLVVSVVLLLLGCVALFFCPLAPQTNVVSAATGHNCAPPVPPGIPGSPQPAPAASGVIDINEILVVPHSTWNCSEHGTYFFTTDSWIELYDTQNQPYNLYSAHAVIDCGPTTNQFAFPFGASIAAHGYLVVFPYTDFFFTKTSTSTFRLLINGVVVDQVTIPKLGRDQSYARTTDGAPTWIVSTAPTIDASNTSLATPTPTPQSSGGGGSGGSGSGSGSGSHGTGESVHFGTSPDWKALQLPTQQVTSTQTPDMQAGGTIAPSLPTVGTSSAGGLDASRRYIVTGLLLALGAALWWRWRMFRKR